MAARAPVALAPRRTHGPAAAAGFTLIEILVVLAIVAVLALALTLAVAGNTQRRLDDSAEQVRAHIGHACDQAQLSGREIGVTLDPSGYAFARLDGDRWHGLGGTDELRARRWPAGLRVTLERDGRVLALGGALARVPQLVCFSSGELTPFVLTLQLGEPPLRRRVLGTAQGTLELAP